MWEREREILVILSRFILLVKFLVETSLVICEMVSFKMILFIQVNPFNCGMHQQPYKQSCIVKKRLSSTRKELEFVFFSLINLFFLSLCLYKLASPNPRLLQMHFPLQKQYTQLSKEYLMNLPPKYSSSDYKQSNKLRVCMHIINM